MKNAQTRQRAAFAALVKDPGSARKAEKLVDVLLADTATAQRVLDEVVPKPAAPALDLVHKRYDRHNLHMPDRPNLVVSPGNLASLVATLQQAADSGQFAKAIGDGYGFANTGFTRGTLIPTVSALDDVLPIDASVLRQGVDPLHLVQFEAGATVDQLNHALWKRGQTLRNQPGFERLTFAGTMSSGGHGSGSWLGPLSSHVRSLHLVTIDAKKRAVQLRIEPKDGITSRALHAAKYPKVELIQDDAVFHACTCAMGCLGVLYSLVVSVRPAYNVRESRTLHRWADLRGRLPALLAEQGPGKRLHSMEIWINPYAVGGKVSCVLGERSETTDPPRGQRGIGITLGGVEVLLRIVAWAMKNNPELVPVLMNTALKSTLAEDVVMPAPEGLNFGATNYAPVRAASGGVPTEQIVAVIEGLIAMLQKRLDAGEGYVTSPIGLRFVKAAQAHLSPAHGRDTCMIEVPILEGTPHARATLGAYHDFIYAACKGRPHWGQINDMPAERLGPMYPALPSFLESFRVLNPLGIFDNAFTDQVGLRALAG